MINVKILSKIAFLIAERAQIGPVGTKQIEVNDTKAL